MFESEVAIGVAGIKEIGGSNRRRQQWEPLFLGSTIGGCVMGVALKTLVQSS